MSTLSNYDLLLFTLGGVDVTIGSLLKLVLSLILLFWFAGRIRDWATQRILPRFEIDPGARLAIGSIVRYVVIVAGIVVILQNAGINLTAFSIVAGALGAGIGFGLQNIFSNFISGLIIMLERPITIGDRIEVGGIEGSVREIGARRTTVITLDNTAILIPNQKFIVDNVVNLAYTKGPIRLRIPVSVPEDRDLGALQALLLAVASADPDVLTDPSPSMLVTSAAGALSVELAVWHEPLGPTRQQLSSRLNAGIRHALGSHDDASVSSASSTGTAS